MKKAFDQTVRDIKREVNKKVLKVPSIEQKVLDATSNEPWGPHGTLLADIAQASRNYHEYQMIMSVIWKRINDTGKNWRHVYKALTVLEYLVAHGSERVIDEIREHAYQIQTLSDFQYIDSSGKDQGSNVRKKSQSLVVLVNDKDRIQEARQKAAANREKYRNTSAGGMYRPGSYSSAGGYGERYDDDRYDGRYGNRDEERNGYGREREWGSRDDDRYGRYGDPYGRDGDRYSRDDDRSSRDGYRDDDYRGRSRSVDDYQYGSRSRSSDRDRDRAYEEDGQYSSSRGNGARPDDQSQDGSYGGRHLERKYSEQNLSAPPSYEEAVSVGRSPTHSDRDGEIPSAAAPKSSSPPASVMPNQPANNLPPQPAPASPPPPPSVTDQKQDDGFDEFDPRGSFSAAAPTTSNVTVPTGGGGAELDLLGSLSDSFSANSLALVPTTAFAATTEDMHVNPGSGPTFVAPTSASSVSNQAFDDPFGDGPFKAMASSDDLPAQPQNVAPTFATTANQSTEQPQLVPEKTQPINNFGGSFPVGSNMQYSPQELSTSNQDIDILADILPPTGPQPVANPETAYTTPTGQPSFTAGFPPQISQTASQAGFPPQTGPGVPQTNLQVQPGQVASLTSYPALPGQPSMQSGFPVQSGQLVPQSNFLAQTPQSGQPALVAGFQPQMGASPQQNPNSYGNYNPQLGSAIPVAMQMSTQQNSMNFPSQLGSAAPVSSQASSQSLQFQSTTSLVSQPVLSVSTGSAAAAPQPAKDKFETKSTVWADTLSRGLVNLNISGPKTNPLADIGVDFEAINRKEKRMEKPTTAPAVSNITMGKAMGSGSGIGRAGAGALRAPPNTMMGSGMGMGMGGGLGPGIGMGGYGSVNQPMGGGMGMNMPMGMNMGMGQGGQMQRPMGFAPGSNVPGGYNPMMGMGNYGQQPYGGGYR
ncbi:clathrin interactor EPSIN 2-like isoform X3 [Coffea eugenioides]|uniref:clathrin interactor EPSIN 2-like isoform X3 n=1 Tax=Coffea eugenioides TaxID=49369 RepID=UPI000F60F65F|nr:clathrin interactor EPSIN 2-like isoform X3 [Coffea eugenioides]